MEEKIDILPRVRRTLIFFLLLSETLQCKKIVERKASIWTKMGSSKAGIYDDISTVSLIKIRKIPTILLLVVP